MGEELDRAGPTTNDRPRRIASLRLTQISKILNVEPCFFLENGAPQDKTDAPDQDRLEAFIKTPEGARFVSGIMAIESKALRSRLVALIIASAGRAGRRGA